MTTPTSCCVCGGGVAEGAAGQDLGDGLVAPAPPPHAAVAVASRPAAGSGAGSPIDTIGKTWLLALCATAVLVVSGLRAFFDYQQRVGMARIGNRVLRRVRTDVYVHVQSLSLAFHNRARSGDLIVRVTRDVSLLRDVASTAMLPLAANLLIFVGMLSIMLVLQWQLALLSLLTLPLFWISTVRLSRGIRQAARKQRVIQQELTQCG